MNCHPADRETLTPAKLREARDTLARDAGELTVQRPTAAWEPEPDQAIDPAGFFTDEPYGDLDL